MHYGHTNVIQFCPDTRPCSTVDEMDSLMISRWNKKLQQSSTVYMLGDVTFYSDVDKIESIISQLHGTIHLIYGNHDQIIRKTPKLQNMFASVSEYKHIRVQKRDIVLSHYAMRVWNKAHHGAYHLYGHSHGALEATPWGRSMDVGIDARPNGDMSPWSFEEVNEILHPRPHMAKTSEDV